MYICIRKPFLLLIILHILPSQDWPTDTRAYIYAWLGQFSQVRNDCELIYGIVGEQFFPMLPKNQDYEWVLETLGDAIRR